MEKEKKDRLSEFTRLAKERELTPEEQAERQALREEYLAEWRRGTEAVLQNTYIVDEDGNKRKLEKK
ncbi:MAG TPA: DUF896 family protein [Clostridiales bacterium]|nr:DUF896 family protein [Clostridiales bacterium]HBR07714.1 DUF896 family protein [Clostridiales bacterium]